MTDNGTQFTSDEFELFLKNNAVKHLRTAAYHPSSNGEAERLVQTMKRSLRKIMQDKHSLSDSLRIFLKEYRATSHSQTGESPSLLFLKRSIRSPFELIRWPHFGENTPTKEKQNNTQTENKYSVGDPVWVRINFGNAKSPKWAPGIIKSFLGGRMVEVHLDGPPSSTKTLHVDQIRSRKQTNRVIQPKSIFDPSQ